jgi:hypothetical protein
MLIIDGAHLGMGDVAAVRQQMAAVLARNGTVLFALGGGEAERDSANVLLPSPIQWTARDATMLVRKDTAPLTAGIGMHDLYFAEDGVDKHILKHGLDGPFVTGGQTLLEAGNIDWTLFDNGEAVKCGALVLYEQLQKPVGAALVVQNSGGGRILVSAIDATAISPGHASLWRKLLAGMGVAMGAPQPDAPAASGKPGEHDLLRDGPPGSTKAP